jgi:N-dimethylarginine dimethylaminohydrolase
MCTPEHFDVVDVKNVFMEGNEGAVDKTRAREQWVALRAAFERAGYEVVTIRGVEGLEDMVFAANQALPRVDEDGTPSVVLSKMAYPSRRREIPYFHDWFEQRGYTVLTLGDDVERFEGQGDAIWHPGKQLLWGGVGQRTSAEAYEHLARLLDVPVIALDLIHPSFYHLDTCFCALSSEAVLVFPPAFSDEGRAVISRVFSRVVEVGDEDATRWFACNAHAVDGRTVFMQRGATGVVTRLRAEGFDVVEVETDEFLKSGGSVFCMKMMIY